MTFLFLKSEQLRTKLELVSCKEKCHNYREMKKTQSRSKGKVVLFQPFIFSGNRMYYSVPLAMLGISRLLDKEGYQIKIITPRTHKNYVKAAVREAQNAICFGVSTITGQPISDNLKVARALKAKYPNLPIVWGGWHPSILPQETIKDENVDIVVKGQGERTFTELVHALKQKKSLKNILGIVYKNNRGKIIENPDRPLESLDNFPPIPYHLVDVEKFITPAEFGKRSLSYYSSYGCPHRCLFCVEPVVSKHHWVGVSPERAADEITEIKKKYNLDSMQIIDSNFFIGEDRAKRFAERLIKNNTNIKWGNANGRARQLSQYCHSTWRLLKKSGLTHILVGAESGDNKTLEYMKKDITIQDTIKLAKACAKYDIKILCAFLVGFPRTNSRQESHKIITKEIKEAYKLIDRLLLIYPRIRMMLSLFLPYPSSGLFEQSQMLGVEIPTRLEDWHDYLITAEKATSIKVRQKWVTKSQAFEVMMCSKYIFFFLDADSLSLSTMKTENRFIKLALTTVFKMAKSVVSLRWKYKYFGLPIDFYLFNILRNYFSY